MVPLLIVLAVVVLVVGFVVVGFNKLRTADIAAAMSVEGLLGTDRVFAPELQAIRPHPGQADSAANLVRLLAGSGVVASHRTPDCTRVQDAYSLRCAPQVHGAARDTANDEHAGRVGVGLWSRLRIHDID